mmetsp:Transcript_67068/g.160015  ORF Transcript_67068/g.160015 Transcript_67068/m.160015 type:complete len:209 (+) Transcript_67068:954-1580(+)
MGLAQRLPRPPSRCHSASPPSPPSPLSPPWPSQQQLPLPPSRLRPWPLSPPSSSPLFPLRGATPPGPRPAGAQPLEPSRSKLRSTARPSTHRAPPAASPDGVRRAGALPLRRTSRQPGAGPQIWGSKTAAAPRARERGSCCAAPATAGPSPLHLQHRARLLLPKAFAPRTPRQHCPCRAPRPVAAEASHSQTVATSHRRPAAAAPAAP